MDQLLKADVIERVDASTWVSTILVTGKKDDGIRMCADLHEPKKAVVTDCYPLPHINELLSSLHGSKFVPNFATVVYPMHECVKEGASFTWTAAAQSSFDKVKILLVTSPALTLFDPALRSVISTDASDYGVGAMFAQVQPDGTEKPVAFAFRTLTTAERKYSIVEKEALACVWATEKWQTYLWGQCFTLRTDHQALTTLLTTKEADFEAACSTCPEMTALREQITLGWPPSIKAVSQDLRPYYKIRDELSVKDSYIFRSTRLLVPVSVSHTLIALAHESHQGMVCTKQRLHDLYWWHKWTHRFKPVFQRVSCQTNDKMAFTDPVPLQPVQLPDGPWKKLGLDVVGPFETAIPSCRYAITMTDYYSKWPELAFSYTATTDDIVMFMSSVFSRHGNPECIVTDNGPQFTLAAFAEFLEARDICHFRTSVYYPAANAAVEMFHRALRNCIQTAILQSQPWKEAVTDWLQVYRVTPHATTSASHHKLLYNWKMRTRLNILPLPHAAALNHSDVRATVLRQQEKMRHYTDFKCGARTPSFCEGEKVRIRIPHPKPPKAHPRFSAPAKEGKRSKVGPGSLWKIAASMVGDDRLEVGSRLANHEQSSD
ncbi:hypothetical protein LDENG_00165050 [Lucifuga dentata]|nr:hypothetical protein LDENG_00165050 [Lucifuga dentata]